jgi:hypothetical protein
MIEHISFYIGSTDEEMKKRIMRRLSYLARWFVILEGNHLLEHSFKYKTKEDNGSPKGFMDHYHDLNYHIMDMCYSRG